MQTCNSKNTSTAADLKITRPDQNTLPLLPNLINPSMGTSPAVGNPLPLNYIELAKDSPNPEAALAMPMHPLEHPHQDQQSQTKGYSTPCDLGQAQGIKHLTKTSRTAVLQRCSRGCEGWQSTILKNQHTPNWQWH